ncbi:DUF1648 domain-containing protein [Microbacterium sp. M3]|uniref:DUF1648 domain-containing protein n=1 Tax=Microbacterium arthrosphaerae TaxID=792652 RepID=A0ABU4GVZ6_9MICO|nr:MULTISPECIES: DUF1648 domain-containing protein [Microbacterium]MDW4571243.1 DUF1648 domain-containing protein [Microbacterium arthrosphaerae]MDW7605098.1 DUF1648 domain-containing protein [Microbacterium sp. M3]
MTAASGAVRRARRAYLVVAVWVPLAVTTVAVVLMLTWLGELPAVVATHWNGAGEPDGFGPAWASPVLAAVLGYGLAALFAGVAAAAARTGEWGPTLRFLGALACGLSFFLMALVTATLAGQRGLEDAADAPSIVPALAVAGVLGLVTGAIAWWVQPAVAVSGGTVAISAEAMQLAPGERAVWLRTTTMARPGIIAVVGVALLMAALAVVLALTGGPLWGMFAGLAVLFGVLAATTCVFRVRVSADGLRVRSVAGFPRFGVPIDDVAAVSVVHVQPMAQFGGWGIRAGLDGRFGLVLRAGEAIQVERRQGRTFVVTVDDAATGASLLEALAARASRPR